MVIGVVTKGQTVHYVRSYVVEYFDNNMNTMQPISDKTGQQLVSIAKMFYVVKTVFYLRYKWLVLWMALFSRVPIFVDWIKMTHS